MLGTDLPAVKWRALANLVLGCIFTFTSSLSAKEMACQVTNKKAAMQRIDSELFWSFIGYGAVLIEVLLSGFASIFF